MQLQERLEAFIEAVNSSDNSHLVSVPTGTILSDMLFGSPIYQQARKHEPCSRALSRALWGIEVPLRMST